MKYLRRFEGKMDIVEYKYDWCRPNNPIRIEIEKTIKDILAELIEDGLYKYNTGWTAVDPCIRIYTPIIVSDDFVFSRSPFDIDLVRPFADQIIAYLNSEGFKIEIEWEKNRINDIEGVYISYRNEEG